MNTARREEIEKERLLEEMIQARMNGFGEDRLTACIAVKRYICQHLNQQEND